LRPTDAVVVRDRDAQQVSEPILRPRERILLLPVPVVDVGAVFALLHDPALVALAELRHGGSVTVSGATGPGPRATE
jgi:hypothetical protein